MDDVRESILGTGMKRTDLIKKIDIHTIGRDYNITYNTMTLTHDNDAVREKTWVEQMRKSSEYNPILYYKRQENSN